MSAEDLDAAERLFIEAINLPPEARREHVERACSEAPWLRQRVLRLLEADAVAETADLPSLTVWSPIDSHVAGDVVADRYRLVRPIGTGGLGVVWEAQQLAPVERRVALKFIRHDFDGRHVFHRFALERAALSRMDHPGIARIFDAGREQDGRPYFAMELVDGQPITTHCDEGRVSIAERVTLLAEVCLAVHHAHQKGIIHRDLKPSNILVARTDDRSVPKVIDFGIAKAVGPDSGAGESLTAVTRVGQLVGTPAYMAPEQLAGDGSRVDVRCDIFALGVVLHELLAGCLPHDRPAANLRSSGAASSALEPRTPSSSVRRLSSLDAATVAARRRETPRSLRRRLRGELDWVVGRAVAAEPGRRYASASELGADLQRWLRREPVTAGPPGAAYLIWKFVQRHTTAVAAALLVVFSLSLGLVGTTVGLVRAREAERRQRDLSHQAETRSYQAQIAAIDAAVATADTVTARRLLAATDPRRRGWEWTWLEARSNQSDVVVDVGGGEAWGVAFTPDGAELLVSSLDGSLRSFDAATGRPRAHFDLGLDGPFWVAVADSGDRVCVGSHSRRDITRYEFHLLEWPGGRLLASGSGRTLRRPFSPDGSLLVVADSHSPVIRILHAVDGSEARTIELPREVGSAWAVFCADRPEIGFWSMAEGIAGTVDLNDGSKQLWSVPILSSSTLDPTKGLYFGADATGDVSLTRLGGEARTTILRSRVQGLLERAWLSPDGLIAIGACQRTGALQLHDVAADRPIGVLSGHQGLVADAAVSPDGRLLASVGGDGTLRLWHLPLVVERLEVPLTDGSGRLGAALSRDGSRVASCGWGSVQMWSSADGALQWMRDLGTHYVELAAFSPDERRLAIAETNGRALILSADNGTIERSLTAVEAGHTALCWDALDRWIVLGGADGVLHLLEPGSGERLGAIRLFDGPVSSLALSRDGVHFIAGAGVPHISGDNWARILKPAPAEPELVVGRLEDRAILARIPLTLGPSALCLSPDDRQLFMGRPDGAVLRFDLDELLRMGAGAEGTSPSAAEARAVWCIPPSEAASRRAQWTSATVPLQAVSSLACTSDGSRLLIGHRSGSAAIALPSEQGLLLRVTTSGRVHAAGINTVTGALVVACQHPLVAIDGVRQPPEARAARERIRRGRAAADPIVAEEQLLDRVLARIDGTIEDESLRDEARRYAEARGEHRATMIGHALGRARVSTLDPGAYHSALVWIEELRSRGRNAGGSDDRGFDLLLAVLNLRLGRADSAIAILEPLLASYGGADAVADLSIPAVLALAWLHRGAGDEAVALMGAIERRLAAGEALRGEALWYVPQAREALRRGVAAEPGLEPR